MNLRTCFAKTDNLDTLLIDCEYLANFCHKVKIYLLILTWWGEGSPMSFSVNMNTCFIHKTSIWWHGIYLYDDWFDQESNYLEFSETATFTIWFSDWGKNTNYCAQERDVHRHSLVSPLFLLMGGWQLRVGGYSDQDKDTDNHNKNVSSIPTSVIRCKVANQSWIQFLLLMEISPISNPIQ